MRDTKPWILIKDIHWNSREILSDELISNEGSFVTVELDVHCFFHVWSHFLITDNGSFIVSASLKLIKTIPLINQPLYDVLAEMMQLLLIHLTEK